jgi:DNA repair exonuclease SbcCD ATPase subunit
LERKKSEPITFIPQSAAVNSSQATTPTGSSQDLTTSGGGTSRADRLARKRSKSRSTQGDFRIQLTLEQKLDIITSEVDQAKNEKTRREAANEKKIDQLESDLEWIEIEIADFEIAITDFLKTKDISIDKRTHKLIGEKIERYFHERIKSRESLINKLRDRSSGLRRQIGRLETQLRQKEEMGETLHEVDFNQLKIENKQYLDKIDEKNIELILLKRQVGKATQSLNRYKDELHKQMKDYIDIQQRIDKQSSLYDHAENEMINANDEQLRAAKVHQHLAEQTEDYQVPEVLDYVKKKALLYNLERDCEVWERKVEIASMALQQSKQQWQTLQRTAQYQNNPPNWNNELQAR